MTGTRKVPKRKTIDHRAVIERTYQMREERGHQGKWRNIAFDKDGRSWRSEFTHDTEEIALQHIAETE